MPIRLSDYAIAPGDALQLNVVGDWRPGVNRIDDAPFSDTDTTLVDVFSSSNVLLPSDQLARVPGAIDAGNDLVTQDTCALASQATDIPEDFGLFPWAQAIVPERAEYLFLSVDECHFEDNNDPDGDFGLNILVGSPALPLADRVYNFGDSLADELGGPSLIPIGPEV